jgi:lysophospholipase L1-like esterase
MKNRISLVRIASIFVILVFAIGVISCPNTVIEPEDDTIILLYAYDTRPIVCFGDSITEGFQGVYPNVDKTMAFPAFLGQKLKVEVINSGVTGHSTTQSIPRIQADVLDHNPQAVLIHLGANDYNQAASMTDANSTVLAACKANLQTIIDQVKAEGRKIYLVSEYGETGMNINTIKTSQESKPTSPWPATLIADYEASFELYRDMHRELATANPDVVLVTNAWNGTFGVATYMFDNLHPNYRGYARIADALFVAMGPWLYANNLIK